MTTAAPHVREHDLADLVRDLDYAVDLLRKTPPGLCGFARLGIRDRSTILFTLTRAADLLHELRSAP
jgi:hypothetical protein